MKRNTTKYALLGLLTIEPLSGYDIKKLIKKSLAHFWSESNGQIYPTLNQMIQDNWIELLDNTSTSKKPSNRYAITELGRAELQKWMRHDEEKSVHRDENLLKLFFGSNVPKIESILRLKNRKERLTKKLHEYHAIATLLENEPSSSHKTYWILTVKYGMSHAQAAIDWCQLAMKTLENAETC